MTKVTFYGSPAWVGGIQSPTVCEWWNNDPAQLNWDRALLYTVDLSMTPSAATAGRIKPSQIDVDDHVTNGGRTTIGPMWPSGTSVGACFVSDGYIARCAHKGKSGVPAAMNGSNYEYTTIQYFDGEQHNRRFHGFHANVLQTNGGLSLVQIWNPGTGTGGGAPAGTWWLDLGVTTDPNSTPLSQGKPGALYLDVATTRQLTTFDGKLPKGQGASPL